MNAVLAGVITGGSQWRREAVQFITLFTAYRITVSDNCRVLSFLRLIGFCYISSLSHSCYVLPSNRSSYKTILLHCTVIHNAALLSLSAFQRGSLFLIYFLRYCANFKFCLYSIFPNSNPLYAESSSQTKNEFYCRSNWNIFRQPSTKPQLNRLTLVSLVLSMPECEGVSHERKELLKSQAGREN